MSRIPNVAMPRIRPAMNATNYLDAYTAQTPCCRNCRFFRDRQSQAPFNEHDFGTCELLALKMRLLLSPSTHPVVLIDKSDTYAGWICDCFEERKNE